MGYSQINKTHKSCTYKKTSTNIGRRFFYSSQNTYADMLASFFIMSPPLQALHLRHLHPPSNIITPATPTRRYTNHSSHAQLPSNKLTTFQLPPKNPPRPIKPQLSAPITTSAPSTLDAVHPHDFAIIKEW